MKLKYCRIINDSLNELLEIKYKKVNELSSCKKNISDEEIKKEYDEAIEFQYIDINQK